MTILLKGTLSMNTRGIAMLHCDVGHFLVEHLSLKDVAVGKHTGFFEIQKIQPHVTDSSQGQLQLILRATLKHFALQETTAVVSADVASARRRYRQISLFADTDRVSASGEVVSDDIEAVMDDASVTGLSSVLVTTVDNEDMTAEAEMIEETVMSSQDALPLSDTLLPNVSVSLPDEVELDPTLPRQQLREKTQQLKAAGYRFDPTRQVWQIAA